MVISAVIGAIYGLVAGRFAVNTTTALIGGIINGVVWWVLGALVLMPLMLGMSQMVFVIGQAQWMSLLGHIIYGLVTSSFDNRSSMSMISIRRKPKLNSIPAALRRIDSTLLDNSPSRVSSAAKTERDNRPNPSNGGWKIDNRLSVPTVLRHY
jgi:hypothetical protein